MKGSKKETPVAKDPEIVDEGLQDADVSESSDVAELSELELLKLENEELRDKWLRAVADLDNFRKRTSRDRQRELEFCRMGVLLPLFEVLDDLERALDHGGREEEDVRTGVEKIRDKFVNQLASIGVTSLSAEGEAFDPECMEALATVPTAEVESDRVIGEIRKGYRLGDRIIRPAQVSVSAPPVEDKKQDESS